MFCNKTKSTIKNAYKLRKDPLIENLQDFKKIVSDGYKALDVFESRGYLERCAYKLALENNFKGSPEFYWHTAEKKKNLLVASLESHILGAEEECERIRKFIRIWNS